MNSRFLSRRVADPRGFSLIELMMVTGLTAVIAAIAIPMMSSTIGSYRLSGDARGIANALSLAKLRAAAEFTKSRLYIDTTTNGFHIETWQKAVGATPGYWLTEGGTTTLSSNTESYSFGVVSTPPTSTQPTIGMAPQCLTAAAAAISNTSCVVFNSRGIPVVDAADTTGSPTNADAIYVTDGTAVYGITLLATGSQQVWVTLPRSTPSWTVQ